MVRAQLGGSGHGSAWGVGQPASAIGQAGQFALAHCSVAGPFTPGHGAPGRGAPSPFQGVLDIVEAFRFTISDGTVTAASMLLPSGAARDLMLAGSASYALDDGDVLATQAIPAGLSQVRYGDVDSDGLYAVIGTARVLAAAPHLNIFGVPGRETLAVTLTDGAVSGVSQLYPNGLETVLLSATVVPSNVSWTVVSGLVVERHTLFNGSTSWEVFRDGNGDGLYTEVANGTGALVELTGVLTLTEPVAALL